MFSLCIATMDRYDTFLSKNLPKYLANDLISEIIITDENGNDAKKIELAFDKEDKLRIFTNMEKLGPFKNKLKACSLANNEWIVLMDSDNFADVDYFITGKNYIDSNELGKNVILAPCFAKPRFDYRKLSSLIYKKDNFISNRKIEQERKTTCAVLMNTGNYILNKYLVDNINLSGEEANIAKSSACDVIYFNVLLFEQLNLELHVIPDMEYEHVVHDGSVYIQTHRQFARFNQETHVRFNKLFNI
jgi:hypothetical protein